MSDIGESIVGAYLRHVRGCDLVTYNERTSGQGEIDVVGVKGDGDAGPEAWVCEVSTHLDGLLYGSGVASTRRSIEKKVARAREWAGRALPEHRTHVEVWAPSVPTGQLTTWMAEYAAAHSAPGADVRFVVNAGYTAAVQELLDLARHETATPNEPAYRLLQILTHLRGGLRL